MIAVFLVLAVASNVICRTVVGLTPAPTPGALIEANTEEPTSSPTQSPLYLYDDTEGATSSPTGSPLYLYGNTEAATSSPTSSPTHALQSDYPDCKTSLSFLATGFCASSANNAECGWDGGDCCECTCQSTASNNCGDGGFDCKDPSANFLIPTPVCRNASFTILKASTCSQDVQLKWAVNNTAAAKSLAEATSCSVGGNFEVEWTGYINVTNTIYVHDGTSLRITGASDAIADGGGTVQVFIVANGYLYLKNLEIVNGNASDGGAIFAASESEIFVEGVSFSSNTAKYMGGAVYAASSNITLVSATFNYNIAGYGGAVFAVNSTVAGSVNAIFHDNSADYGGAFFVLSSIVIGSGNMTLTNNNAAIGNGGALYIAENSFFGWNMQPAFSSTSKYYSWNDGSSWLPLSSSSLNLSYTSFSSNTARNMGGAVYAASSNITLVSTTFNNNTAGYGGAIYVVSSIVIGSGNITLTNNNASGNGGALYIAEDSFFGGNMQPEFNSTSQYDTSSMYYFSSYHYSSSVNLSYISSSRYADIPYPYWNEAEWIDKSMIGDTTVFLDNIAEGIGGAIYAEGSELSWSGSVLLEQNSAQYGGAIYLENDVIFQTRGMTSFFSNSALYDGGAIGAADQAGTNSGHSWLIFNGSTVFMGNTCGENGGAIDLSDIHVAFNERVVFTANSAASFGGALYASQKEYGPTLTGVIFSNNIAEAGGAVYFSAVGIYEYSSYSPSSKFIECRFEGNSASSTGGAIHSIAGKDLVWGTNFTYNTAGIGGALPSSGDIVLLNSSFVENKSGEEGGPAISNGGEILTMDGLIFSGNGYQCSAEAFMDLNEIPADQTRYETVCDGCGTQEECSRCIVKDSNYTPVCTEVFDHTDSQGGIATLETLVLEAGYWRATNSSREIMACFNKHACGGGLTGNPDNCSTGYEGPYCAVCSQDYASTLSYYGCSECSEATSIVPSVCAVIIVAMLGLLVVRHMISIEGGHRTPCLSIDQIKAVLPLQSFKIIIVSWQIVTQFSLVANAVYPRLYQRLLDVVALANFDLGWIPSAACIMDVDFHVELVTATIGPLILVAFVGLTYTIALHRNRGSERALSAVRQKHVNATIVIALLLYSMASSAVFRTFACDPLDDGKVYLRSDYRIECNSPTHKAFQIYAAFMVVVYPLGIPIIFALLLFRNRQTLVDTSLRDDTRDMLQQWTSNLWKPYKPSAFYYEVVECGRRVMLTGVVVFMYPNTAAQISITLAIAFIFALTSERLNPYDSHWDGWISRIGHVMVSLTMYVALLAKIDVSNEDSQSQALLAGVLVAAHIAMVLAVVAEAIVLMCSVRQRDLPQPRRRRINYVMPLDDFSSIESYSVDSRRSQQKV